MRAFLGIDLDEDTRADVASFARAARAADPSWQGEKWVPDANLHLTLRFLGEIDPGHADELVAHLTAALGRVEPFVLEPAVPVEPVPSARRARMLWTRYDDPDGRCAALASAIDDALARCGVPPESKPFVPHITLARARRPRAFAGQPEAGAGASVSVRDVTLFSSVLRASSPRYERLAAVTLGAR